MELTIKCKKPSMPNFILLEEFELIGNAGTKNHLKIPIQDLTLDQAREYAQWMKDEFIGHWNDKQSTKSP